MISTLFSNARLAQASYADFSGNALFTTRLQTEAGGFTATQAARFANRYSLVAQFNDDASAGGGNGSSFSVSVFKESGTNKLTVALRGTADIGDYIPTDANIFLNGADYDQIVAMQNWWLCETSPSKGLATECGLSQALAANDACWMNAA